MPVIFGRRENSVGVGTGGGCAAGEDARDDVGVEVGHDVSTRLRISGGQKDNERETHEL